MAFFDKESIIGDICMAVPNGTLYHFGVLTSKMHMAWVKSICGRLESRFRYSKDIVYNNYPFPVNVGETKQKAVEIAAQSVLDARAFYPKSSLTDLYETGSMPLELSKAHNKLDSAVDKCYGNQKFNTDFDRVGFLFSLYESYTAELFTDKPVKKKRK